MAIGMSNTSSNSRSGGGGVTPAVFVYGANMTSDASVRLYNTSLGVNIQGTYQTITYNDTEYNGFYITGISNLYSYTIECIRPTYITATSQITIEAVEINMVNIDLESMIGPWSTASLTAIQSMISAHYAGALDLHDYWSVGDTRTVTVGGTSTNLVLMDTTCNGFTLTDTSTKPAFIVGTKAAYINGNMNSSATNVGGWASCARRTWCNGTFKTAMDTAMPNVFKQFTWKTGKGGKATSGLTSCNDYFALAPEKAIFGSRSYSYSDEADLYNHWTWYATSANRIKSSWEASPGADTSSSNFFCYVYNTGSAYINDAYNTVGIAPFGCI